MSIWTIFLISILFEIASLPVLIYGAGKIFDKFYERRISYLTVILDTIGKTINKIGGEIQNGSSKANTEGGMESGKEACTEDSCGDGDHI